LKERLMMQKQERLNEENLRNLAEKSPGATSMSWKETKHKQD